MKTYDRFKELNIDHSAIGLEQRDTQVTYYCTPEDAHIIGWAGVDGIHYCTIPEFGEMIFAISPMNFGDCVHPIAQISDLHNAEMGDGIMHKGKGVYLLGFYGVENDLPYDAPFPTLLINTEVSEDSDASRLVRELLLVDYPAHQFEAVSKEIRSVQEVITQAFKDSDQMPANAIIVFGIHENNDISVEDVLRYLEIPAVHA